MKLLQRLLVLRSLGLHSQKSEKGTGFLLLKKVEDTNTNSQKRNNRMKVTKKKSIKLCINELSIPRSLATVSWLRSLTFCTIVLPYGKTRHLKVQYI